MQTREGKQTSFFIFWLRFVHVIASMNFDLYLLVTHSIMKMELSHSKAACKCNPGPMVIKPFSCSAQLIMKFQLLINAEIHVAQIN